MCSVDQISHFPDHAARTCRSIASRADVGFCVVQLTDNA